MCCVGFAYLDVVCDEFNDFFPGNLVCSSFLSVCVYVYCVEIFAHIE